LSATVAFVNKFLGDLGETSSQGERARGRTQPKTGRKKWLAPPAGRSKINVDAAVAKSTPKGAVGVVCRTLEGAFIGAAATVYAGLTDPGYLEALACREALDTAADLLLGPIHVASDCLEVINGLKGDCRGRFRNILKEISDRAREREDTFFVHEGRESNGEAHRLSRFASSLPGGRYVWWDQPPDGLHSYKFC
jgi:ribonuclease HI